jgi:predicted acylesterase/phospholipase RssA
LPEVQLLAVSGGGENGAFGSGLLCGWSEHGTRPVFELVTGVSTGALTAPFAYLGSSYDPQLRTVYTELKSSGVFLKRGLTAALFDDALSDNSPLFKTISGYLNEAMLAALANAYDDGRLLLIGTTDLDAQQPVIWNMGAIAKSGHPRALDTIRRILLASAAIPGAFPPTLFDVVLDGKPYQELHVDGGAFAQAFLYPAGLDTAAAHTYDAGPAGGAGDRLCHPQWPTRCRMGDHGTQYDGHRRARHRHHDRSQRLERRDSYVQQHAT